MRLDEERKNGLAGIEVPEECNIEFPEALYLADLKKKAIPLHWHEKLEIGFVAEGAVLMRAGKEKLTIHAGDGFFVNSRIPHYYKCAPPAEGSDEQTGCRIYALVFDPVLVGGRIDSFFWRKIVQPVLSSTSVPFLYLDQNIAWKNELLEFVKKACIYCDEKPDGYEIEVRYHLSHAMSIIENHLPMEQLANARRIARDNERVLVMMNYIQNHFSEEVSDAEIAASVTISVSECLRCFNNTLGITPIRYVKYYRIQHAAEQLRTTDAPITDIAVECGFQDMSYFARAFKQAMNVTPSEYRKKFIQN